MDWFRRAAALSDCSSIEADPRGPIAPQGDAFRKLAEGGFDFSRPALIDFSLRVNPRPAHHVLRRLCRDFPNIASCRPEDGSGEYLEFQVYALVSPELIVNTLCHVMELVSPYKGSCPTWGVVAVPSARVSQHPISRLPKSSQLYLM